MKAQIGDRVSGIGTQRTSPENRTPNSAIKPRIGVFDFSSCEGCELQIANIEEEILDLLDTVELVSFREVMKEHSDRYDIAIVEGSIIRPMDDEALKRIRQNAKIVVALGACACLGGVNRIRNKWPREESVKLVYGGGEPKELMENPYFDVHDAKAVDEVVKVDYYIPGCPMRPSEFKRTVVDLALGKKPALPSYPVCVECKKNENQCVFEKGLFCLGPLTRAGCDSWCPNYGNACEGCRGMLLEPETKCVNDVLKRYGLNYQEMVGRRNMYNYGRTVEK